MLGEKMTTTELSSFEQLKQDFTDSVCRIADMVNTYVKSKDSSINLHILDTGTVPEGNYNASKQFAYSMDMKINDYRDNPSKFETFMAMHIIDRIHIAIHECGYDPGETIIVRGFDTLWEDPIMYRQHRIGCYGWIEVYPK